MEYYSVKINESDIILFSGSYEECLNYTVNKKVNLYITDKNKKLESKKLFLSIHKNTQKKVESLIDMLEVFNNSSFPSESKCDSVNIYYNDLFNKLEDVMEISLNKLKNRIK